MSAPVVALKKMRTFRLNLIDLQERLRGARARRRAQERIGVSIEQVSAEIAAHDSAIGFPGRFGS